MYGMLAAGHPPTRRPDPAPISKLSIWCSPSSVVRICADSVSIANQFVAALAQEDEGSLASVGLAAGDSIRAPFRSPGSTSTSYARASDHSWVGRSDRHQH